MSDDNGPAIGFGSRTEFAACRHVLTGDTGRVAQLAEGHLFADRNGIAWEPMLEQEPTLSDGERARFLFALSLWTGQHYPGGGIMDVLRWCDDKVKRRVLEAVEIRAGLVGEVEAAPRTFTTCSWCHETNHEGDRWCRTCKHAAQKPRNACDCKVCDRAGRTT